MQTQTINPATGEVLANYEQLTSSDLNLCIQKAVVAFHAWEKTDFKFRHDRMMALASCLRRDADKYARLIALEMGKPITSGVSEILKCAWVCEHYAQQAEAYLSPKQIQTDMKKSFVTYRPLGLVLAIMPWNFPFWQVFRFAAPNIMAGNVGLLKHAAITTGSGEAIMALFEEAGFPEHVFSHLVINPSMTAEVIKHPDVAGVTLTGSEEAGKVVAEHAGRHLKKVVLELGGSDPYLILDDADLERAASCIVASRLNNSGQTCIAAKRVIAVKTIVKPLIDKILNQINYYIMGSPMSAATHMGPLARKDLRDTLHHQVIKSIEKGAICCVGGQIPEGDGFYYPPTVLRDVKPGMPAFDEELFGPVISVISVANEKEAIELANQSRYGLGAAVFTSDLVRGERIASQELNAGSCFVNAQVVSDPRLPFGGIKQSGFGRELGQEGILEFVNTKTVCVYGE